MFIITKRYGRNETRISDFRTEQEAVAFIMEKLKEDKHFKLMATYCLYEGADLLKEYTQTDIPVSASDAAEDTAASGKGSGKSFAPSPFSTTPRLGPQTWIKEDSKDKDDEKK